MKNSIKKLGIKILFLAFLLVFIPASDVVCQSIYDYTGHEKFVVQDLNSASFSALNDYKMDRIPIPMIEYTSPIQLKFADDYEEMTIKPTNMDIEDVIVEGTNKSIKRTVITVFVGNGAKTTTIIIEDSIVDSDR